MGDVDYYALQVGVALRRKAWTDRLAVTDTLLIGLFSASKSVLDMVSVAISQLNRLNLKYKEQDFTKGHFWKELNKIAPNAVTRYQSFDNLFKEIVLWRDAAVHRVTPLVTAHGIPDRVMEIKLAAKPGAVLTDIMGHVNRADEWVEPLHFYNIWRPKLLDLCAELCQDIAAHS